MLRRLLTLLSAVSLVPFLATVALWGAHAAGHPWRFKYAPADGRLTLVTSQAAFAARGRVGVLSVSPLPHPASTWFGFGGGRRDRDFSFLIPGAADGGGNASASSSPGTTAGCR